MVEIINYTSDTSKYIKDLNYEWLTKYFSIEPNDEVQLNNPEEEIVKKVDLFFMLKLIIIL